MSVTRYHLNPDYYTMKMSCDDQSILISSEILPNMPNRTWRKIANNTLIELRRQTAGWSLRKWDIEAEGAGEMMSCREQRCPKQDIRYSDAVIQ